MTVPTEEQETTISYSRSGKCVDIWTSDTTVMHKLDDLCEKSPDFYSCIEVGRAKIGGEIITKTYKIADKTMLSFRSTKTKRTVSEEQRLAMAERLKAAREKRNKE